MKPLMVLLVAFAIALLATKIFYNGYHLALSAKIAMGVMLLFTASAHFAFTKGMALMLPPFVPYKIPVVYFTGVVEIAAAIGLLIHATALLAAWLLIAFFVLLLPANVYAALKKVNYQKANFNGQGINYLWFRVPLQILFIVVTYFAAIKN